MITRLRSTLVAALVLGVAALAFGVATTAAERLSPAKLTGHGWTCFDTPEGVHCAPPGVGAPAPNGRPTYTLRVFATHDVTATDADFLGTELLVRDDLFNHQPCPQSPTREYTFLDFLGDWTCHHDGI